MNDFSDEIARIRRQAQADEREHQYESGKHAERKARMEAPMGKTFQQYAIAAAKTAKFADETRITYNALKLAGEAGEIADKLGKGIMSGDFRLPDENHRHEYISPELRSAIVKEAGDLLWHLTALLGSVRITLDEVAEANIEKLRDRTVRDVILGAGDDR